MADDPRLSTDSKLGVTTTTPASTAVTTTPGSDSTGTSTPSMPFIPTATAGGNTGNTSTANDTAQALGFTAEPNPLAEIEQPSYHWKFYVGPDLDNGTSGGLGSVGVLSPSAGSTVTIAETGVTGFNIQEITLEDTVGPNMLTRSASARKFKVKILEPYGCTMPDKMLLAAKAVGVRNYMKAPWYLSLDFLGYDPDSGNVRTQVGGRTWAWKILILKLNTDLTATGSMHTIEAVGFDDQAHFNQYAIIPSPINIDVSKGSPTVGDALKGLKEEINANIKKRYGTEGSAKPLVEIDIVEAPYQGSSGSVSSPFQHKIVRDTKHHDSSRNQSKIQISKGTDIGSAIDQIMSASETAVKMANPTGGGADSLQAGGPPATVIHKVEVKVELKEFNTTYRDYARKITYTVKPYEVLRTAVSTPQITEAEQEGTNRKKVQYANSKLYMRKAYDYLFTGKNTEVIDMDISLNFQFSLATNFNNGFHFYEAFSPGRELNSEERKKSKEYKPDFGSGQGDNASGGFKSQNTYAEDLDIQSFTALPYGFAQDAKDPRYNVSPSVESNNLRSRSIYGTILNQLYGSMDGNLGNIHLVIRGDPYWLGHTETGSNEQSSQGNPNFSNGEHMFVLRFLLPQGINEDTGDPILKESDMYSGFYAVTRVENQWIQGMYKQILHSVRIPGWEIAKLLGNKA